VRPLTERCVYGHGINGVYLTSCPGCHEVVVGTPAAAKWHERYREEREEYDRIVRETPIES
jgi:hypothetical protein